MQAGLQALSHIKSQARPLPAEEFNSSESKRINNGLYDVVRGMVPPLSKLATVSRERPALAASSRRGQSKKARAARHWAGLIVFTSNRVAKRIANAPLARAAQLARRPALLQTVDGGCPDGASQLAPIRSFSSNSIRSSAAICSARC